MLEQHPIATMSGGVVFVIILISLVVFWCTVRKARQRRAKHHSKAVELIWSEGDVLSDSTRANNHEVEMYELNDAAKAARDEELDNFDWGEGDSSRREAPA